MSMTLSEAIKAFDPEIPYEVPTNWFQGRTAYGGLLTALALEAVLQTVDFPLPPLQSAHITFVSPSTKEQSFKTRVLRHGKSVITVAVECFSSGEMTFQMTMIFATPRTSKIQHNAPLPPKTKAPESITELDRPNAPPYIYNFNMRSIPGAPLPFSGASHPQLIMWARHLDTKAVDPVVALLALADVLPPAAVTALKEPVPISTISWTFNIINPPGDGEWFLLKSSSRQAAGGYSLQDMEIWNDKNDLILIGCQTVAIFA